MIAAHCLMIAEHGGKDYAGNRQAGLCPWEDMDKRQHIKRVHGTIEDKGVAESPCVRNCCLDENDICVGCLRSLEEIVRWADASSEERKAIMENARLRREAKGL
jgi:predicted Fe-S protein YdhL (DUF1289 family)